MSSHEASVLLDFWTTALIFNMFPIAVPFYFHLKSVNTIYQTTKGIPNVKINFRVMMIHLGMLFIMFVSGVTIISLYVIYSYKDPTDKQKDDYLVKWYFSLEIFWKVACVLQILIMLYFFRTYGSKEATLSRAIGDNIKTVSKSIDVMS